MAPKKKADEPKILLGRPKGSLKIGLVGLPNVGKSTTFNILSKQSVRAENFPFCTLDPHEARMHVPDDRFKWLCDFYKPKSEVPANLTIYDIAGLVPGAHKGEGLGNAFLSHIQAVDGIYHVVRAFDDTDIIHTEGEVNPVKDLQTIHDELCLKDLERCEKLIEEATKQYNRNQKDKAKKLEVDVLTVALELLKEGKWISDHHWKATDVEVLNEFQFLSAKPVVYLVNLSEKDFIRQKNKWLAKIHAWVLANNPGPIVPFSAEFEKQIASMDSEEERQKYIKDSGASKSMLDKIINVGYSSLHLCHYFTCGEDEVKCWTLREGTKAPQAAGIIHTDFMKGFVCAEVFKYSDLVEHKTEADLRAAGLVRQQGKNYIVQDGDVMYFKCNTSGLKK